MHTQILTELSEQKVNMAALQAVANELPDNLPRAWFISAQGTPSIHFNSPDQRHVEPVLAHFGRIGWTARAVIGGGTEYFLTTNRGVEIVIENAVPRYQAPVGFPDGLQSQN